MADSKYKLTYFNINGLGESIRFILAYAGVDFEDNRVAFGDWPSIKEKQPFGTLPVLEIDGKVLNQSVAICRFLGKRFGLVAEDPFTEALLEAIVDNVRDSMNKMRQGRMSKTPEGTKESDEARKYLFDKLEPLVSEGYFYGSKPTWVDIYFAGIVETISDYTPNPLEGHPNLKDLVERIKGKGGVKEYIINKPLAEPHPTEWKKAKQ